MNLKNIYLSQCNHLLRSIWKWLPRHKKIRFFLFYHCKPLYTKLRWFNTFGSTLNYRKKDKDIHEKLFWLSVYYHNPLIPICADKYRVREYVAQCGCQDILNQLYQVCDKPEDIDFEGLPQRFVIKSNAGSGDNLFCLDKDTFDKKAAIDQMNSWGRQVYGIDTAEYQYADIPQKIICEKFLLEDTDDILTEYQFFCFNGKPESILVRNDLETSGTNPFAVTYSLDWERLFYRIDEDQFTPNLTRPQLLQKMTTYATILASPFPHVRVDFYIVQHNGEEKLYFGEMTFSTHGNVLSNYKESTLRYWANLLVLPIRK